MVLADFSAIESMGDRYRAAVHESNWEMKAICDRAAATERDTHAYTNRTYNLQKQTYTTPLTETDDGASCELGCRTDYAEYVNLRGLMGIDDAAADAQMEVFYLYDSIPALMGLE